MTWDPASYPARIRTEIHDYDELQTRVAKCTIGVAAGAILDLGIGTGETAGRVLRVHPQAHLVGIDSSAEMLRGAAETLPRERVSLLQQDLNDPLPGQDFDLVVSVLAVHHLEGQKKADLFQRVAGVLRAGGRVVIGDVVIPADPLDAWIDNELGYDFPSTIGEHLQWMSEAGFAAEVTWVCKDLAVLTAAYDPAPGYPGSTHSAA